MAFCLEIGFMEGDSAIVSSLRVISTEITGTLILDQMRNYLSNLNIPLLWS